MAEQQNTKDTPDAAAKPATGKTRADLSKVKTGERFALAVEGGAHAYRGTMGDGTAVLDVINFREMVWPVEITAEELGRLYLPDAHTVALVDGD